MTAPAFTFADAVEIVSPPTRDMDALRARYAALKVACQARPGTPSDPYADVPEHLRDLAEKADLRDRYRGDTRLPDDGYSVERWARPGR